MRNASGFDATNGSEMTGSSSYTTRIFRQASSAIWADSATTRATWSPINLTRSAKGLFEPGPQSTGWSGTPRPYSLFGTSLAVNTNTTPGVFSAAEISIDLTIAWTR